MISALAVVFVVVTPGLHTWWSSRKLLRHLDDPLFPDLLHRRSQRVTRTLALALGVGLVAARQAFGLLLIGALVGVAIGAFPARRRIFDESRSLGAYLSHVTRFYLGIFGGLFLLACLPQVMRAAGPWAAAAGVATGILIVGYGPIASRFVPALLGATTLARPDLEAPFARILATARTRGPVLFEADAPGGTWVNAFALPSVARPAVLFTRGLLDALDPEETTAIFAHEVAHLEHYHPRRLWASHFLMVLLVALPVFLWAGPYAASLRGFEWAWTVAIALGLTGRLVRGARHEAESDLRAVELGADPEALVRGLTKIHALVRIARRRSEWNEKRATHPSLARRIRAIRAAAGTKRVPELAPLLVLASDGSGRGVVLDPERLHWLRGIPEGSEHPLEDAAERRSLRYDELRELRLDARATERALVFKEASGDITRIPFAASEAPRLQEALDAVDDRVGYRALDGAPPAARLWTLVSLLLSLAPPSSLVPLAVVALALPGQATLAALGASGLLSSLLGTLRSGASPFSPTPIQITLVALASTACLVIAVRRHRNRSSQSRMTVALGLLVPLSVAALALPGVLHVATSTLPLMHAHLWARSHPSIAIGLVGMAAALWTVRSVRARAGAAAGLAATVAVLALGSLPARELGSEDVFRAPGPPLLRVEGELEPRRELDVSGVAVTVTLSPRGERVAVGTSRADRDVHEELSELDFHVETLAGGLVRFRALDLEWWDEDRVLVAAVREGDAVLRLVDLGSGSDAKELELTLPALLDVDLQAEPSTGRWQVTGRTPEESELLVLRGEVGDSGYETLRFGYDEDTGTRPDVVSSQGVGLEVEYALPQLDSSVLGWSGYLSDAYRYLVRRVGLRFPGGAPEWVGSTALQVDCRQGGPSEDRFLCVVGEEERTSFWSLDPRRRVWTSLGAYPGWVYPVAGSGMNRLVLLGAGEGPVLANLELGIVFVTALPRRKAEATFPPLLGLLFRLDAMPAPASAVAWRDETVAVAAPWDEATGTSRVTSYELHRGAPR